MKLLRPLFLLCTALVLAACASTTIRSAWFDTSYTGGPMKRIVVVGVGGQVADRRVFEDSFAAQLQAAGVEGIPGYTVASDETRMNDAAFAAAVEKSGADGLLVVRLLNVDTRTQVSTAMVPGPAVWGPWGPYGGGFYGPMWFPATQVNQFDVAQVESSLYDTKTRRLIWSATTETINPAAVAQETPRFAAVIIGQLRARGLIAGKP
ncbi:MAG: hypothetical protein JNK68_05915 [Betaproteobacteria bacterium]|nr:hypothetical protein [Betaproteobacteria bacterium]